MSTETHQQLRDGLYRDKADFKSRVLDGQDRALIRDSGDWGTKEQWTNLTGSSDSYTYKEFLLPDEYLK